MPIQNSEDMLQQALTLLDSNRLQEAKALLTQLCTPDCNNAEAWLMLGAVNGEFGNVDVATTCIRRAITLDRHYPEAYLSLATVLMAQGMAEEARTSCQQAVEQDADYPEAWLMLARINQRLAQLDEAARCYQQVVALWPGAYEAHYELGGALRSLGKFKEAYDSYRTAVSIKPDNASAHAGLGEICLLKGDYAHAAEHLEKSVAMEAGRAETHSNLGLTYWHLGRVQQALASCQTAIHLNPELAEAYSNQGLVLNALGRSEEASASCKQAMRLNPFLDGAYVNLGMAYHDLARYDEAREAYEKTTRINPGNPDAHWNLSLLLLLNGEFERGWEEYEWRWRRTATPPRPFKQALWDGSALAGRTILLHAEQGLGDTLQFVRYAQQVKARGGRVIVECQAPLATLVSTCDGVDEVVVQGSPLPAFDVHAPLLSLPRIFQTQINSVPNQTPYLQVPARDPAQIEAAIAAHNGQFKIGIVWAGRPTHPNDRNRSCELALFGALSAQPNVALFSLQKGERCADLAAGVVVATDLGGMINDFSDTAAAIARLDLVISVDTSVAHLAGALGKPTWVLLPSVPDWRWMLTREDTPWYPHTRLFRQHQAGDWPAVFERVATALENR